MSPFKEYPIITLCGSVRIGKELWDKKAQELSLRGFIVLKVDVWGLHEEMHNGSMKAEKEMLNAMHKRKIELSDCIYVLNKDKYIGESTKAEIEYAKKLGKPVFYME